MQHGASLDAGHRRGELIRQPFHLHGELRHVSVRGASELSPRLAETVPQSLYPQTLRGDLDGLTWVRLLAQLLRRSAECRRNGGQMSGQISRRTLTRLQVCQQVPQVGVTQVVGIEVDARDLLR